MPRGDAAQVALGSVVLGVVDHELELVPRTQIRGGRPGLDGACPCGRPVSAWAHSVNSQRARLRARSTSMMLTRRRGCCPRRRSARKAERGHLRDQVARITDRELLIGEGGRASRSPSWPLLRAMRPSDRMTLPSNPNLAAEQRATR